MKKLALGIACSVMCAIGALDVYATGNTGKQEAPVPVCTVEEFKFLGNDADMVGPGRQWEPSGVPDGHFRITLAAKSPVSIRSITIRASRGGIWSPSTAHWIMGIYSGGEKILMESPREILQINDEKVLDLYIEPNEYRFFASGDEFQVAIQLADGTLLVSHCQVQWKNLAQHIVAKGK